MKSKVVLVALALLCSICWYFITPLFTTIPINDPVPTTHPPSGVERLSDEERLALALAMETARTKEIEALTEPMPTTQPVASAVFEVQGTVGHPAEGTVRVIETETGPVIRYENFSTINGPQLHMYLAKDLDANEYIDLGPIRGTTGNINYVVPPEVDLSEYKFALHWCVPFGVLFNYAQLAIE